MQRMTKKGTCIVYTAKMYNYYIVYLFFCLVFILLQLIFTAHKTII